MRAALSKLLSIRCFRLAAILMIAACTVVSGQTASQAKTERGSRTAKDGFRNETEIAEKFNNWKTDIEAQAWLGFMGHKLADLESVSAAKPHGEKADVEVTIRSHGNVKKEGISIKLVSTATGFNQIDKRWLAHYAELWKMPADVADALKLFVGEVKPNKASRNPERMFLTELDPLSRKKILDFFSTNKNQIVSDLFKGDGDFAAGWLMVALKSAEKPRWVLRSIDYVIKFYGDGPVEVTRQGNMKIGRITMQRKGGDGGRETAKMLQFKVNPALLFDGK